MSRLLPRRVADVARGVLLGTAVLIAGCGGSDTPTTPAQQQVICAAPAGATADSSYSCPAIPAESIGQVAAQDLAENQITVDPAVVIANNNFGLTVLNTLLSQGASGNTAIAPFSLAQSLEVADNGAAGTTQQAMAQVVQLDAPGPTELGGIGVQQL